MAAAIQKLLTGAQRLHGRHKVIVAHDGQQPKAVAGQCHVQHEPAVLALCSCETVRRKLQYGRWSAVARGNGVGIGGNAAGGVVVRRHRWRLCCYGQ